jgi:hypothetical protein
MFHPKPGIGGLLAGIGLLAGLWFLIYCTREAGPFHLDPKGKPGGFEPFLTKYLRLGEFTVGLATGSIVLLIGSSAFHGQNGILPWYYTSPLVLLGCCVVYGIAFMVWLIYHYEDYQHGVEHTKAAYSVSLTLGFGSLACFLIGYGWLIFRVTQ